jgi:hypothetical protein
LNEWEHGYEITTAFTGDRYESVYEAMLSLIDKLEEDDYHGAKLEVLLKNIALDGRSVEFLPCSHCINFCYQVAKPQEAR